MKRGIIIIIVGFLLLVITGIVWVMFQMGLIGEGAPELTEVIPVVPVGEPQEEPTPVPPMTQIVVAVQDIPRGFEITRDAVALWGWPADAIPPDAIVDAQPAELDVIQRDVLLERLRSLRAMIDRVERALNRVARQHPGVDLLKTIPGVGNRTAEAVVAWVDNPQRFPRIRAIGCYFGLIPSQDASGPVNRLGHITREGPSAVRSLLTEAAWQAIRRSERVRSFYERVKREDPERNKIAVVATAHYLLRVMLSMLRTGEVWRIESRAT